MLCNRVDELRRARGLTTDQLAVYAGVNRTTVARLERNDGYEPRAAIMLRLARYFGVGLGDLFYLDDTPPPGEDRERVA